MKKNERRRIVIAVTESCPVRKLWETATRTVDAQNATLVALFFPNRRWQRAASLPFTREFSSVGGGAVNFSPERAHEIDRETQEKVQRRVEELATATHSMLEFKVLHEEEVNGVEELSSDGGEIVVASSNLAKRGILSRFEKLRWQIVIVDAPENSPQTRDAP